MKQCRNSKCRARNGEMVGCNSGSGENVYGNGSSQPFRNCAGSDCYWPNAECHPSPTGTYVVTPTIPLLSSFQWPGGNMFCCGESRSEPVLLMVIEQNKLELAPPAILYSDARAVAEATEVHLIHIFVLCSSSISRSVFMQIHTSTCFISTHIC